MRKNIFTSVLIFLSVVLTSIFLLGVLKGSVLNGMIQNQATYEIKSGGPYELSISTGRYALTRAIGENHSLLLTKEQARFAAPDVVEYQGKFMSIFTPGVTFLSLPLYFLGKSLGFAQLFTYGINLLFALFDFLLVARLAKKLQASTPAALGSGLVFVFATNALAFTQSYTQHLISAGVIISLLILSDSSRSKLSLLLIGVLYGLGIMVDFPNAILNLPILAYVFFKQFKESKSFFKFSFNPWFLLLVIGAIPMFILFGWYNYQTTGSYTKLGQSIGKTHIFDAEQPNFKLAKIKDTKDKSTNAIQAIKAFLPFDTRKQLNGLYTLTISDERSWIFFSPVLFIGILGLILVYKKKTKASLAVLLISVLALNILLYSSFGDPWGGWSFGPRYLIPGAAIVASGIGIAVDRFRKNILFWLSFLPLLLYSIFISVSGALTSLAVPPKVEAIALTPPTEYTVMFNIKLLENGTNNSLFYNLYLLKSVTPLDYALIFTGVVGLFIFIVCLLSLKGKHYEIS